MSHNIITQTHILDHLLQLCSVNAERMEERRSYDNEQIIVNFYCN